MPPRYVCPSMGAFRRSISKDIPKATNCCSRNFHASTRRLEDSSSGDGAAPPAPSADRSPRKARTARVVNNLTSLQNRRAPPKTLGLAGGAFVSGRAVEENADVVKSQSLATSSAPKIITPRKPLIRRQIVDGPDRDNSIPQGTMARAPPGTMARAPAKLRISSNAPNTQRNAGPNLRGRNKGGKGGKAGKAGNRAAGAGAPKKREGRGGGKKGPDPTQMLQDVTIDQTLSDGMIQHLLRLQRKEWDRVPYEPKYAAGSLAANELIHAGRELFRGEAPPVKVWGHLEKKLNIVGMHGAAAHLQVRRVPMDTTDPEYSEMKNLGINKRLPSLPKPAKERATGAAKVKVEQIVQPKVEQNVEA